MPYRLPAIPERESLKFHKALSTPRLLKTIKNVFAKIPERQAVKPDYTLVDVLMSAFAVFGLKYPTLLQFDKKREERRVRHNLRTLYGVMQAPCDTTMREICDEVDPQALHPAFLEIIKQTEEEGALQDYRYLGGLLLSVDGSGHFGSGQICCPECCKKRHRNGDVEYYHQLLVASIVHPEKRTVLLLFPEAISKQDGTNKNDCESNAAKRLLPAVKADFPKLKFIVLEDARAADGPHIRLLQSLEYSFIITAKGGDLPYLFEEVQKRMRAGYTEEFEETCVDGITRGYRWVNGVPLNKANADILVNYLDYWEIRDGKEYNFVWITDIELTPETVNPVMRAGRTRWKVENETLNTLKNLGYNLEVA